MKDMSLVFFKTPANGDSLWKKEEGFKATSKKLIE